MTTEIKSPLTEWGKELRNFCEKHPQVTFNAPPQDQPEIVEGLQGMKITEHRIALDGVLNQNRPMLKFFQALESGDMIMMFVAAGKDEFLTIVARFENLHTTNDLPVNARIDFHRTKTFKKIMGQYQNLWLGSVVAATCVKHLSRQMCIVDREGEIFEQKAIKFGVSAHNYHQLYPKLKLLDTGERVCEISNGVIYDSPIYRVLYVSGGSVMLGEYRIQPDSRLTSCALNHISKVNQKTMIDFVPRM